MNAIRVALIEDDDLTRMGLRTALQQQADIEWVGEASNGKEGIALLLQQQPHVAIVDIGLSDMDGVEITQQYRAALPADRPPCKILILTLHDEEETVLAAFSAGADSYCMKDISIEFLVEAIKATHEGNVWIDPAIARIVLKQATSSKPTPTQTPNETQDIQHPLTERELEVLQLIVNGYSNAQIADKLYITIGTVKTHVRNILNKLCADDRTQAAVHALRSGLVG